MTHHTYDPINGNLATVVLPLVGEGGLVRLRKVSYRIGGERGFKHGGWQFGRDIVGGKMEMEQKRDDQPTNCLLALRPP